MNTSNVNKQHTMQGPSGTFLPAHILHNIGQFSAPPLRLPPRPYLARQYRDANDPRQIAENARAAAHHANFVAWQQAEATRLAQAKSGIVALSGGINPKKNDGGGTKKKKKGGRVQRRRTQRRRKRRTQRRRKRRTRRRRKRKSQH